MGNFGIERFWASVRVEFDDEKLPVNLLSNKKMSILYNGCVYKCDSYAKIIHYRDYFCICLKSYDFPCTEFMPFKWSITELCEGKHHYHLLGDGYMKGIYSHISSYARRILRFVADLYKAARSLARCGASFMEKRNTLFLEYLQGGCYLHPSIYEFLCVVCVHRTSVTGLVGF
jgi:hypothetical protein